MRARINLLLVLLCLAAPVLAHKLQVEPIGATIRVQPEFYTIDFRGNVQDITQSVDATEADERGDTFTPEVNQRVQTYFNENFVLTQGGKKLVGKLESLTHQGSLDPSASQFHLLIRYPRDPAVKGNLVIHNKTLGYLPNARIFVSAGGATKILKYEESMEIDEKRLQKNILTNIIEFAWMGVEHIFTGFDHILFILALLIASTSLKELIKTLTGFTIAHSITLCLAALGIVVVPEKVVAILVPLSIVYVGLENVLLDSHRHRFWISSAFGLVHGFGFADILSKYLPADSSRLWCLFSFNLGVEIFQVALCAVAFPLLVRFRAQTIARQKSGGLAWDTVFKGASIAVSLAGVWFLLQALGLF